jgi:hypothetical protein
MNEPAQGYAGGHSKGFFCLQVFLQVGWDSNLSELVVPLDLTDCNEDNTTKHAPCRTFSAWSLRTNAKQGYLYGHPL